jgi:DNA-binding SARP family transcriptional activator
MSIDIRLLGPPHLTRDGVVYAAARGRKVWALLAYLVLAEQPPSRQHLIELLFPGAEDPAGALRWNLSELRRLLGGPDSVGSGNTVQLRLPSDTTIDVVVLQEGSSRTAVAMPQLGRELLEGIDVDATPGFTAWLLVERRRLQALSGAVLREGSLRSLATGDARRAVELATRLVGADPLSEDAHILLVRSFAASGDEVAVESQLAASLALFRDELGVDLGRELYEAARMDPRPLTRSAENRAAVQALLESGEAAVSAGAIDLGLERLRGAASAARDIGESSLEATGLLALGAALVHATKGRDEEGSAALHRAAAVAEATGDRGVAASAHRELAYVELLRGDYARGETWLRRAIELAGEDPVEMGAIHAIAGARFADLGAHDRAIGELERSIDLARSSGQERQRAWSTAVKGRTQVQQFELDGAEESLRLGCEVAKAERWTAFLPYPEAFLGEVWTRQGKAAEGADAFEHAFALGRQVDDACWEGYGMRGLGLLRAAAGDLEGAVDLIEDALTRCARQRDTHLWVHAYILDALCATATYGHHSQSAAWVADLGSLAGRTGMREFSVRAYLYQRDLGDPTAVDAARALAVGIENPYLLARIDPDGPPLLLDLVGKS